MKKNVKRVDKNKVKLVVIWLLLISSILFFISKNFVMGFVYLSIYLIAVFVFNNNIFEKFGG